MEWLREPFFQVTLPLMVTFVVTMLHHSHSLNKRVDDLRDSMNRRLDEIIRKLERIDIKLEEHDKDIAALKERSGLVKVK